MRFSAEKSVPYIRYEGVVAPGDLEYFDEGGKACR
jgi:hypothetical protein